MYMIKEALLFLDMPSSQPIDIPDAKKRNKKKKRCRATDSFSGRFEGNSFHDHYISVTKPPYKTFSWNEWDAAPS